MYYPSKLHNKKKNRVSGKLSNDECRVPVWVKWQEVQVKDITQVLFSGQAVEQNKAF